MTTFGERLKLLREERGLSARALAQTAGLSHVAISYLESGARNPTWGTVESLADALGVSTEDFRLKKPGKKKTEKSGNTC